MDSAPWSSKCSLLLSSGHLLNFFLILSLRFTSAVAFPLSAYTLLCLSKDIFPKSPVLEHMTAPTLDFAREKCSRKGYYANYSPCQLPPVCPTFLEGLLVINETIINTKAWHGTGLCHLRLTGWWPVMEPHFFVAKILALSLTKTGGTYPVLAHATGCRLWCFACLNQ